MPATADFTSVTLHIVTGKGGTGKTTAACALGLALAREGKRVLVAEVEGRQGISQTFDIAPLGSDEVRILTDPSGGEVWGLSVDPKAALLEYLQLFYKLGRAGSAMEKVGAIDFATTIAPGVRDVLLIGKVYEAVGRPTTGRGGRGARSAKDGPGAHHGYDCVVLDAPPTGRSVRFLNVGAGVADLAKVGPIKSQADAITAMLRRDTTVVHMVTLLEAMPVQESVDGLAEFEAIGLRRGALIVNQVREEHLTEDNLADLDNANLDETDRDHTDRGDTDLDDAVRTGLSAAGLKPTAPMVRGLIAEGQAQAARLDLQDTMRAELEATGLPLIELATLPDGVVGGGLSQVADDLTDQGAW